LADDAPQTPDPFDVRTIRHLVRLMSRHDMSEIDLHRGEFRIRLRRGQRVRGLSPPPAPPTPPPLPPGDERKDKAPGPAQPPAAQLIEIKSPTVGTFYAQANPDSPPYVSVGSRVTPSTVVCLIEAMKIFNEITADCSGVIREVLVKNKEPVEYNTVLFRVDPHG
jgi:acetyl-CoA carboxylase biotin carboxyl carrier protein